MIQVPQFFIIQPSANVMWSIPHSIISIRFNKGSGLSRQVFFSRECVPHFLCLQKHELLVLIKNFRVGRDDGVDDFDTTSLPKRPTRPTPSSRS